MVNNTGVVRARPRCQYLCVAGVAVAAHGLFLGVPVSAVAASGGVTSVGVLGGLANPVALIICAVLAVVAVWALVERRKLRRQLGERARAPQAWPSGGSNNGSATEHYQGFFEIARDAIFVFDVETGKVLDANRAACELIGHSLEALRAMHHLELHPPEQQVLARRIFAADIEDSVPMLRHIDVLNARGERIPVDINASPLVSGGKSVLIGVYRDVTHLRSTEAELRHRDRLLAGVSSAINESVLLRDPSCAMNTALYRLGSAAGVDRAFLFENRPHPTDGALTMSLIAQWCREGVTPRSEVAPYTLWAGHYTKWAYELGRGQSVVGMTRSLPENSRAELEKESIQSLLLVPIIVDGNWWGFIGFDQCSHERVWEPYEIDIMTVTGSTLGSLLEQARLNQDLQVAQHRYHLAIGAAQAGVWDFHVASKSFYMEPAFERQLGYAPGELGNSVVRWNSIVVPEDFDGTKRILADCISGKRPQFESTHRLRAKDGSIRWVIMRGEAVTGLEGKPERVVGITTDVTQLKEAQLELIDAKERAEAANRAKGEFLAMISHEIRTPLNAVIGFTELLSSTELDTEQAEFCKDIVNGSNALLAVINDILDYTKLDSTTAAKLNFRATNPRTELEYVLRVLREKANEKKLSLVADCDATVPESVMLDPDRLRQVFMNIVFNGIKFTEQGGVRVHAEAVWLEEVQLWDLRFRVTDTGCGIPEAKFESIFEPFMQVDTSITRSYGGVGLGLSICRRLIQQMGGTIRCESEMGHGTTMIFNVRAGPAIQELPPPVRPVEVKPTTIIPLKIVYAEDNRANQAVMQALLRSMGYAMDTVPDGHALLQRVSTNIPDVILMDVQMPGLDGIEATRRIRAGICGERSRSIYIIGVTASALAGDREKCMDAGMTDYLPKPLKRADLAAAIQRAAQFKQALELEHGAVPK
ncbi:MAG: PAS domain S-box protein [Verrucomicrobiota bacterium]|nr:PAS domain S-box protein [Verrucomicrobiota bacterium]